MGSDPRAPCTRANESAAGPECVTRRPFSPVQSLSIVGFGALALVGLPVRRAQRLVEDVVARGVNYIDVAPSYGGGEAEEKLGLVLPPHREGIFLAGKTLQRSSAGARLELDQSLRRLDTDRFDLYQFHAVNTAEDIGKIFAPGGAMDAFVQARRDGRIRFIGFSSHSVPAALAMMDRFRFDSVLFPVNYVCYARGNFGPQVLDKARRLGVTCLALKAMAASPWRKGEARSCPNCWYRPIEDPDLALLALRFTLTEDVCALLPPGDERLVRLAVELAPRASPLTGEERGRLLAGAAGLKPILWFKNKRP